MNIHHTIRFVLPLLGLWVLTACGEEAPPVEAEPEVVAPAEPAPAPEPAPEPVTVGTVPAPSEADLTQATETGTLARALLRDPAGAEAALTAAGLTAETFEARVYTIARSPELSTAYRAALSAP